MSLLFIQSENVSLEPRSGHVAVFYKGFMIVFGGYNETYRNGQRHDRFLPSDEIWLYDVEVNNWTRQVTTGDHPVMGISGATACIFDERLIIFGGFGDALGRLSVVFELSLSTHTWRNLTKDNCIKGPYPSKRDKLVCWQHLNKIVYFGGFGPPPKKPTNGSNGVFHYDHEPWSTFEGIGWNNDVCVLAFENEGEARWMYPQTLNESPSPRAAHAGTKVSKYGYVFGGRHEIGRVNDMYFIDLDTYAWHKVDYNSPAPEGRSWHVLQNLSDCYLLLYGGLNSNGTALSDMWTFNLKSGIWNEIKNVCERLENNEATRIWHTAVSTNIPGEVIIFGGCCNSVLSDEESCHTSSVIVYRANPLPLERLCINIVQNCPDLMRGASDIPEHIKERIFHFIVERGTLSEYISSKCRLRCTLI